MSSGLSIAREYFPNLPDDALGYLLWNETAFPCCDEPYLRKQLDEPRTAWEGKQNANQR
jgi:hypothetical protein